MSFFLRVIHPCFATVAAPCMGGVLIAMMLCLMGCQSLDAPLLSGFQQQPEQQTLTVRFATWGSAEELQVINGLVSQFESRHPQVRVDVMHIPDNYDQKIHLLAASGLLPDVVTINSWGFPKYGCYGFFADLAPLIEHSEHLERSQFFDSSLKAFRLGRNGLGAIPRDVSNVVMYVNTDLLSKHHVKSPSRHWTKTEFLALAEQMTVDTDHDGKIDGFGTSFYRSPPLFWLPWVWSAGGDLLDESGNFVLSQDTSVQAIQELQQFVSREHPIAPSRQQVGQTTMTQLFLQQKIATLLNGRWIVPLLRQHANFNWDVWPMPAGKNGSITGVDATGYAMSASIQGEPQRAAWQWIEFLSSQHSVQAFSHSGLVVPARRDVAESEVFIAPEHLPRHARVFLETLENGHPTRSHPKWQQMQSTLELGLEPVWDRGTPWKIDELTDVIEGVGEQLQPILSSSAEGDVCRQKD